MIEIVALIALYLIRAFLAAVLIVAGAAKLADTHGFAGTLIGLGVPVRWGRLIRGLALAIPLLEVGLGIALALNAWPMIADLAVLALLSFFSVVTIVAVLKVPRVTCRCFGALSDSQFNGKGLARSLFLTALALIVVWSRGMPLPTAGGERPLLITVVLLSGYLIFALAAAQASKTIAEFKERYGS